MLIPIIIGAGLGFLGWRWWKGKRERKALAARVLSLAGRYAKLSPLEKVELHNASVAVGLPGVALAVKTKRPLPQADLARAKQLAS